MAYSNITMNRKEILALLSIDLGGIIRKLLIEFSEQDLPGRIY